jgi:hypothetical protein
LMPVQRTKRRASAWLRRDMLSCGKIRRRRREQHTPPLRLNAGRYRLPGNYRSCLNGRAGLREARRMAANVAKLPELVLPTLRPDVA